MKEENDQVSQYLDQYKLSDDIKQMLKELLLHKKWGTELLLSTVESEISNSITIGSQKFKSFRERFNIEFPENTGLRGAAEGLIHTLFQNVFELFFIGNNSALFVELQGLLERVSIDQICSLLSVNKDAETILRDAFSKKTLNDVAGYYKDLKLWNEEDVKFAKKISSIRNGIAHKNALLVSKHLGNGRQHSLSSINLVTQNVDVIPYIFKVVNMLIKLTEVLKPSIFKDACFTARLEAYGRILPGMMSFHCEMAMERIPDEVKLVILNRLYARAILLSNDKLSGELAEFRTKSVEFHRLYVEGKSIEEAHAYLSNLFDNILLDMKEHLKIDNETGLHILPQTKPKTLVEIKEYLMELSSKGISKHSC